MNNISISKQDVTTNKSVFQLLTVAFTTIMMLFSLRTLTPIKAQTVKQNNSNTIFYGNNNNPNKMGGEYIVFKLTNNIAQGLVYVQNSDAFSCFKGNYNSRDKSFKQVTFAYPDMETGRWIKNQSNEALSLIDFPYQLNPTQISEGANNLFSQCFNVF